MNKRTTYLSLMAFLCLSFTSFAQSQYLRTLAGRICTQQPGAQKAGVRRVVNPQPLGVVGYPLYLTSLQLGTPELILRDVSQQPTDSLQYAYQGYMSYQNGRPSVVVIRDSSRSDTLAREEYVFSATGKILSLKTYTNTGVGLRASALETYTYDQRDSVVTYDRYIIDMNGTPMQVDGTHYSRVLDGSGRVTQQIDSSFDQSSGRFFAVSKTEFTYQGTATAPRQVTFSDTVGGVFEPSIRLNRIVWNNATRFWVESADIQIPLTGSIFVTLGSMAGVLTGQEFAITLSFRTSLTGPLEPQIRTTTGFNAQGDKIRDMSESYDTATAGWMVNSDDRYVHTYNNPGGKLSEMSHYTYDFMTSGLYRTERYSYGPLNVTAAKPKRSLIGLSPNPASGSVTVLGKAQASGVLLAATGQVVRQFKLPASGQARVDLSGLAAGIYQVQVEGVEPMRLVVE